MCGITGWAGIEVPEAVVRLKHMCDAIRHRGPDDVGYFHGEAVHLGMRRLSIIDVEGGAQPVYNEDRQVVAVFNGEIYNFQELRRDLERRGHGFTSNSDTEVIVHLYEEYGDDLAQHLRGMFAIALWDKHRRRLLLIRDRLGIKPLYVRSSMDGVVFASEMKSLRAGGFSVESVDAASIARYLAFGYVPDPHTIYSDVARLPPGHRLTWSRDDGVAVTSYWRVPVGTDRTLDAETSRREIRRLLEESVRLRLVSDVPLGAFLSGGVDSSAVVATMAQQMDRPVDTFSIGFREVAFNEAPDARRVAEVLGTNHHELIVAPDVEELFEEIVLAFDEPFADSSAIPTYLVSRLAREHVTVALSGDGGDELFGGYVRYLDYARRRSAPAATRWLFRTLARGLPHATLGRNRLLDLSRSWQSRYLASVAHPLEPAEGGVARPELTDAAGPWEDLLSTAFGVTDTSDRAAALMHVDITTYLPGDILTKVDRMSMAASLEARVPVLDHKLVEFAVSIPSELKIRDGVGKSIFREAVRDMLPPVVFQKRKQGFGVPLVLWFRGPLRERLDGLTRPDARIYEWVEPGAVGRVVNEHLRGRRDHSHLLWKLLVLEAWLTAERSETDGPRLLPAILGG